LSIQKFFQAEITPANIFTSWGKIVSNLNISQSEKLQNQNQNSLFENIEENNTVFFPYETSETLGEANGDEYIVSKVEQKKRNSLGELQVNLSAALFTKQSNILLQKGCDLIDKKLGAKQKDFYAKSNIFWFIPSERYPSLQNKSLNVLRNMIETKFLTNSLDKTDEKNILSDLQVNLPAALFTKQSNILLQKGFGYPALSEIENTMFLKNQEFLKPFTDNKEVSNYSSLIFPPSQSSSFIVPKYPKKRNIPQVDKDQYQTKINIEQGETFAKNQTQVERFERGSYKDILDKNINMINIDLENINWKAFYQKAFDKALDNFTTNLVSQKVLKKKLESKKTNIFFDELRSFSKLFKIKTQTKKNKYKINSLANFLQKSCINPIVPFALQKADACAFDYQQSGTNICFDSLRNKENIIENQKPTFYSIQLLQFYKQGSNLIFTESDLINTLSISNVNIALPLINLAQKTFSSFKFEPQKWIKSDHQQTKKWNSSKNAKNLINTKDFLKINHNKKLMKKINLIKKYICFLSLNEKSKPALFTKDLLEIIEDKPFLHRQKSVGVFSKAVATQQKKKLFYDLVNILSYLLIRFYGALLLVNCEFTLQSKKLTQRNLGLNLNFQTKQSFFQKDLQQFIKNENKTSLEKKENIKNIVKSIYKRPLFAENQTHANANSSNKKPSSQVISSTIPTAVQKTSSVEQDRQKVLKNRNLTLTILKTNNQLICLGSNSNKGILWKKQYYGLNMQNSIRFIDKLNRQNQLASLFTLKQILSCQEEKSSIVFSQNNINPIIKKSNALLCKQSNSDKDLPFELIMYNSFSNPNIKQTNPVKNSSVSYSNSNFIKSDSYTIKLDQDEVLIKSEKNKRVSAQIDLRKKFSDCQKTILPQSFFTLDPSQNSGKATNRASAEFEQTAIVQKSYDLITGSRTKNLTFRKNKIYYTVFSPFSKKFYLHLKTTLRNQTDFTFWENDLSNALESKVQNSAFIRIEDKKARDFYNFLNNFYQFSFLYGWEDSSSVQLLLSYISATAQIEDIYLKHSKLSNSLKTMRYRQIGERMDQIINDSGKTENKIQAKPIDAVSQGKLEQTLEPHENVMQNNRLNQVSFGNTITDPSFSGAGLIKKILESLSPKYCLLQNLIDLKRLYKKLSEVQKKIRSYKISRKLVKKIRNVQINFKKYIQKKKSSSHFDLIVEEKKERDSFIIQELCGQLIQQFEQMNTTKFGKIQDDIWFIQTLGSDKIKKIEKQFFVRQGKFGNFFKLETFQNSLLKTKPLSSSDNLLMTEIPSDLFKDLLKEALKTKKKLSDLRPKLIRRIKLLRLFLKSNLNFDTMLLKILPVLPADLRPIMKLDDQIAASDLNRLYQRIIYRNDRLKKFLKDSVTINSEVTRFAHRLLQEAVDNLIENGKSGVKPETDSRGRVLKSLTNLLKGKGGRFRQNLLGKRVDYSGRSVIVVGPKLKLHECGLPYEMAIELFLPFLLKRLLNYNIAQTVVGAKNLIRTNTKLIKELLREIMRVHPVLLNRAPTLHRLGIQAFQPKLVEGKAILLHPLVCPAFNADFDGDQMAVHVPITVEARAEALKLMFSRNNLLSSATGDPLVLPSQDMVLGCYYLTTEKNNKQRFNVSFLRDIKQNINYQTLVFSTANEKHSDTVHNLKNIYNKSIFSNKKEKMQNSELSRNQLKEAITKINFFNSDQKYFKKNELKSRYLKGYDSETNPHYNKFTMYYPNIFDSQLFFSLPFTNSLYFNSIEDVLKKYNYNNITTISPVKKYTIMTNDNLPLPVNIFPVYSPNLQSSVWMKWNKKFENGNDREQPLEIRINLYGSRTDIFSKVLTFYDEKNNKKNQYIRTTPGKIIFNLVIQKSNQST
jgi:DNA-directed RNA polymerase beta' subunit